MNYKCEMDCPAKTRDTKSPCCKNCGNSRLFFVIDGNKLLCDKDNGFWSKEGCRLSREDMPDECKEYDCRKAFWLVRKYWSGEWIEMDSWEEPKVTNTSGLIQIKV